MSTAAALPPVTGQHRNRALAAARQARAVELAAQGLTYQQVADALGYANRGTVYRLVHQALARDTAEAVKNVQQLEVDRLNALQVAPWDKAMAGDVDAAREVAASSWRGADSSDSSERRTVQPPSDPDRRPDSGGARGQGPRAVSCLSWVAQTHQLET